MHHRLLSSGAQYADSTAGGVEGFIDEIVLHNIPRFAGISLGLRPTYSVTRETGVDAQSLMKNSFGTQVAIDGYGD